VELDLDAAVFVGEDLFAFGADDGGGGESFGGGFLVGGAGVLGDDRDVAADGGEGVSVGRGVLGAAASFQANCRPRLFFASASGMEEVVLGGEGEPGDEELAVFGVVLVVDGVVG
jgi:hypothetical protein